MDLSRIKEEQCFIALNLKNNEKLTTNVGQEINERSDAEKVKESTLYSNTVMKSQRKERNPNVRSKKEKSYKM